MGSDQRGGTALRFRNDRLGKAGPIGRRTVLKRLRGEEGAAAVEFALIVPLLFVLVFGIIAFGVAFMQLQTARGAVREGARTGAVFDGSGWKSSSQMADATVTASTGLISSGASLSITTCTNPGGEARVAYNTSQANGGQGIVADLIFFQVPMNQTVSAEFLCEG